MVDTQHHSGRIASIEERIASVWNSLEALFIRKLDYASYCLSTKPLLSGERPVLVSAREHQNTLLMHAYGDNNERQRHIGYVLLFAGAPSLYWFPRYMALTYSSTYEAVFRQAKVIYNDAYVRLFRMGVGTFDYLWCCRKRTDDQLSEGWPDSSVSVHYHKAIDDGA